MYMIHSVALIIAIFYFLRMLLQKKKRSVCIWYGVDNIRDYKRSIGDYHWIDNRQHMVCSCIQHNDDCHQIVYRWISCRHTVGCNVCYCGTYMISLLMLRIQMYVRGTIITWLIALAGYLIIVLNAPLEHHNKKLTMEQKEKYMIVSAVLGIASMLISFILNIIGVVIR